MVLTLYVDYVSQPARAVGILCKVTSTPFEEKTVSLVKGEHVQKPFSDVNPFKKIPAVKDGDLLILESCAAIRYLAAKYDGSGKWYPSDLAVRCKVDEYLDWQHANTRAHGVGIYFNKILLPAMKKTEPDMEVVSKHEKEMARVEEQFASYFLASKPFITGDSPTIADLVAAVELEQPKAAGYKLAKATEEFLARVRDEIGAELYDEMHGPVRALAKGGE